MRNGNDEAMAKEKKTKEKKEAGLRPFFFSPIEDISL